jgi:hypothetical protein
MTPCAFGKMGKVEQCQCNQKQWSYSFKLNQSVMSIVSFPRCMIFEIAGPEETKNRAGCKSST